MGVEMQVVADVVMLKGTCRPRGRVRHDDNLFAEVRERRRMLSRSKEVRAAKACFDECIEFFTDN